MMNKLLIYDLGELTNKLTVAKAKGWYKSGVLTELQWKNIKEAYSTELFSPNAVIRILLFLVTLLGISMSLGVFSLLFIGVLEILEHYLMETLRVGLFIYGSIVLYLGEKVFFREKKHYKSGITEAIVYTSYSFIYFGLVGENQPDILIYYVVAFIFLCFITVRYHDIYTLIAAIICFALILFTCFSSYALLPFIIMTAFGGLYAGSQFVQKRANLLVWEDYFIIIDSLALLIFYLAGNYFVVRELSISMMGFELSAGDDIPFAFLFYGFTVLIPIGYLAWGILKKSILFIRVSLLTLALTVFTLKYYFSLGHPEITITVGGAILLLTAIALMKYLKISRNGFTRDQILTNKWDNSNLTAFVASQTLGGHQLNNTDTFAGKGGEFGGGGASGSF